MVFKSSDIVKRDRTVLTEILAGVRRNTISDHNYQIKQFDANKTIIGDRMDNITKSQNANVASAKEAIEKSSTDLNTEPGKGIVDISVRMRK